MQSVSVDYEVLAGVQLHLASLIRGMEVRLREAGLTIGEYQVLVAVRAIGDQQSLTFEMLADRMHVSVSLVADVCAELEKRGFLSRDVDAVAAEPVMIRLTALGDRWLQPLSEDVMEGATTNGMPVFRALRSMLVKAGVLRVPRTSAATQVVAAAESSHEARV